MNWRRIDTVLLVISHGLEFLLKDIPTQILVLFKNTRDPVILPFAEDYQKLLSKLMLPVKANIQPQSGRVWENCLNNAFR